MPTSIARRVSYVVPTPSPLPDYLALPSPTHPRNGSPHPILLPASPQPKTRPVSSSSTAHTNNSFFTASASKSAEHPQHSLGIPALALDTSTQLAGKTGPEGILYTGGRDGLVASWELGIPMSRRAQRRGFEEDEGGEGGGGRGGWVRWNELGGVDDYDDFAEEDEDDWVKLREGDGKIPYEERWEVDREKIHGSKLPTASFRQSVQYHTDWVNDIVLCNLNQTLVSASSDRTIRAWNPHSSEGSMSPTVIGTHTDFVRCLAYSRDQDWVASGGFDRQIKLWDISSHTTVPLLALNDSTKDKSSVYSLATNPRGTVIAAGSPERVIRVWDPRAGGRRVCKLVGHTDNIRSLLVSEDGRYMLSGSSDATVKLWSLSAQRVLHTFNHHSDSVWSLFSTHPNLERFYSGDRSGYVASVDMERCTDVSEAECVVICREGGDPDASIPDVNPLATHGSIGINRIVAADDEFLWTATSSSSVSMWRDAGRRTRRIPGFRPASEFEASFDPEVDMEEEEEEDDDDESSSFARAPLLGTTLDQATSSPDPSISSSFPTRISVDLGRSALAQTRSRDSHTVAFAPQPAEGSTTSLLKSSARKGRVSSLFGTPTSVHSQPSFELQASTPPPELAPVRPLLHGIPYDSLVNLGTFDSPYGAFGGPTEADIATIYSAASVLSVPDHHRFTDPRRPPPSQTSTAENSARPTPTAPTSHLPSVVDHPVPLAVARDALKEARLDFQERDLIGDAVPLRSTPESFIEGKHGLVRSLMLNDRQHVVTCDTAGVIAVWNIVYGRCIGLISSQDVIEAHKESSFAGEALTPREALELVKERIEGEAVIPAWCSVDTRIGGLTVHLEEGRCFDAEIHLDELGSDVPMASHKEDQRVSLGKLLLANLFSGFVAAEVLSSFPSAASSTSATAGPAPTGSITRGSAPTFIPIDDRPRSRLTPMTSSMPHTPGGISVLATPAMTPALAPEAGDFLLGKGGGGGDPNGAGPPPRTPQSFAGYHIPKPIPQSSVIGAPGLLVTDATASSSKQTSPLNFTGNGWDYFSTAEDRSRTGSESAPATTMALDPQTPGGSFMGKFKGFGKGKKPTPGLVAPAPVAEISEEDVKRQADLEKWGPLSDRDLYQRRVLEAIRSRPLVPPNPKDIPSIPSFADAAIFIDEESKDAGAFAVIYRGGASTTGADKEVLEMALPVWVLEFLLAGRAPMRDPVKISFLLEPWDKDGGGLMEMPNGNNRLTANRALRVRKICAYIVDRLELGVPRSRAVSLSGNSRQPTPHGSPKLSTHILLPPALPVPSYPSKATALGTTPPSQTSPTRLTMSLPLTPAVKPEELLELVCNEMVLPPTMTLSAVRHFVFRSGGDITIKYRLRVPPTEREEEGKEGKQE